MNTGYTWFPEITCRYRVVILQGVIVVFHSEPKPSEAKGQLPTLTMILFSPHKKTSNVCFIEKKKKNSNEKKLKNVSRL